MTKRIKGKAMSGQFLWIIVPNVTVCLCSKIKRLTYLDIFYSASQSLIVNSQKKIAKEDLAIRKRTLIELDNKVVKLKYFANEMKKQENKLRRIKNTTRNIYDYKPFQVFVGIIEAYLDTVHSIFESIKHIDKSMGEKFHKSIWQEEWFKLSIDLRNLFHHVESPQCHIEREHTYLIFERIEELNSPQYFKGEIKDHNGRFKVEIDNKDMGDDMLKFLDNWAKNYLDILGSDFEMELVYGFEKDGRLKSKKEKLGHIIKKFV